MKYLKILFILVFMPFVVNANSYMLNNMFTINNSSVEPFHFVLNGNASTNLEFDIQYVYDHGSGANFNMPGNYFFVSIVSSYEIDIYRKNSYGTYCGLSCFDNDVYLQKKSDTSGYEYLFYFNAKKWEESLGTQFDIYDIIDIFTVKNKSSNRNDIYFYGAYANDINMMPDLISDANVTNSINIMGEDISQEIINNLTNNCNNLFDINGLIGGQLSNYNDDYKIIKVDNNNRFSETGSIDLSPGTYYISCNLIDNHADNIRFQFFLDGASKRYGSCNNSFTIDSNVNQVRMYLSDDLSNGSYIIFNNVKIEPGSFPTNFCPYGSSSNKIDDTTNAINETNESINNLNDNIVSNDIDSPISEFSDMEDMIAQNGVITNLISLPITLYTKILNSVNGTCSSYSFGHLFGTEISFSCISLQTLLGNTLFGVIDILFSGFTIYAIAKKMIKVFNNFSGLQEGDVIDD